MKKTIYSTIAIGITLCFILNALPVISVDTSSIKKSPIQKETLETKLSMQTEKTKYIPFEKQEKHPLLQMEQSMENNPPDGNIIVVNVKRIRVLDESINDPSYYLSIKLDGEEITWREEIINKKEAWFEWPMAYKQIETYDENPISIDIEVRLKNNLWFDTVGDISPGSEKTLSLTYDPKRGDWTGDDSRGDGSGYGHASGFIDGNYDEKDFEIWFDIYQMETSGDYYLDGDRLTYWEEKNLYDTNPYVDDADSDFDGDGIPAWWEDKYGYDPCSYDNHDELDPEEDGLQNIEEWETEMWCSHPFVQDIFIEVDFMEGKFPWSKPYKFTEESAYLLKNAFAKKNIVMHVDLGTYGGGGDYAPYQLRTVGMDLQGARLKYFLQGNPDHWRRGIFHWAFICSRIEFYDREVGGRMFYQDSFVLARQTIRDNTFRYIYAKFSNPTVGMASVFMHELGHTLGLMRFEGIDNMDTVKPWKLGFWQWMNYESCMNYHYTYKLLDYSEGNNAEFDQNDWAKLDLTRFERDW
jgi:hypothetical protein